jgi:hypothetical protein
MVPLVEIEGSPRLEDIQLKAAIALSLLHFALERLCAVYFHCEKQKQRRKKKIQH